MVLNIILSYDSGIKVYWWKFKNKIKYILSYIDDLKDVVNIFYSTEK